jgi:hypothetical protein
MEQSDRRETNNGLSSITSGKRPREDIPEKPKKRKRLPPGPDECVMCGIQNPTPFMSRMSQMGCRMRRASRAHGGRRPGGQRAAARGGLRTPAGT